jgi:hypothetical protein
MCRQPQNLAMLIIIHRLQQLTEMHIIPLMRFKCQMYFLHFAYTQQNAVVVMQ